jgi:hypothetical protein
MPDAMDRFRSHREPLARLRRNELNVLLAIAAFAIIVITIALV